MRSATTDKSTHNGSPSRGLLSPIGKVLQWLTVFLLAINAQAAEVTQPTEPVAATENSIITVLNKPPPGFEDLTGTQSTQADVYFNDEYLLSVFVEYDIEQVTIDNPEAIVQAIPTLLSPDVILQALTGDLPTHSEQLCHRRSGADCGNLVPDIAAVMFDESRFRLDLFVHRAYLSVQALELERYLPAPDGQLALLNDLSFNASGQDGNDRFSLVSESFLSHGRTRGRIRYGLSNEGSTVYEASMQWDEPDREVELGSFRSFGRSTSFLNETNIVGLRVASSTKSRLDLDNTRGSPLLVFLERRSRVDLLRNGELLDSRFYDAGNQQLDTARLPDGAYQLTIRTVDIDGRERTQTQFFVRSPMLPPKGEPQYYFEMGSLADTRDTGLPKLTGGTWARAGTSRRIKEYLALEGELLHAGGTNYSTAGAFLFAPGWQFQFGLMHSNRGDNGYSLRGNLQRGRLNWSFDYLRVNAADRNPLAAEDPVLAGSYTQGSTTLSFPLLRGQGFIRARTNQREIGPRDRGIGFSFLGPVFQRRGVSADLTFDSNYSSAQSWVRVGFNIRWRRGSHYLSASPQLQYLDEDRFGSDLGSYLDARWTHNRRSQRFGDVQQGAYALRDRDRSIVGSRIASQGRFGFANLDVAHEAGDTRSGMNYSANSRFSLVTQNGKTAMGGGRSQLAAVVVEIDGELPDTEFQVIVDDRVAGYARTGQRGVVSLRPYERYNVRIVPTGNAIFNYDQDMQQVTLYPGNVQTVRFSAHEITVLVAQAMFPDGSPVKHGRISTSEGVGATDANGWFQIEVGEREPLQVQYAPGEYCTLAVPEYQAEEGLAVLGSVQCSPTPAQPSG